ncbi:MAG: hypothetical protein LBR23_07295 [Spirochaetaceae bacterium]|nr:hypothetical protein [Spirochaetaceae bacterium]
MFNTILHYLVFSSAALIYGIGFERILLRPKSNRVFMLNFLKSSLSALGTVILVFSFARAFLIPCGMGELTPLIAIVIFMLLAVLFEAVIAVIAKQSAQEFIAPFLCVLLALWESGNLLDALGIVFFALASYYVSVQLLYTIKKRLEFASPKHPFTQDALILMSAGVIMVVFFSFGAPWLFVGAPR